MPPLLQVIFVLVSDIGVTDMEHVMIQYDSRADVPMSELEKVVKAALDAQWKRLNFGKMIDQVGVEAFCASFCGRCS